MAAALKLIPHLFCFAGMVLALLRGFPARRAAVAAGSAAGFLLGVGGGLALLRLYPAEISLGLIREGVGAGFLLFWGVAVSALYRSTGRDLPMAWWDRITRTLPFALCACLAAGALAGAICACRFPAAGSASLSLVLLALAAALLTVAALALERLLPDSLSVAPAGLMAVVVALLLLSSAYIVRLDLFSPLTMKVMKFCHDFVHQFFESMLIPDHLFIRKSLWGYIGLLFGKEVGLWGALVLLFTPVALVLLAINLEPLPLVAHIRQGAQRRKVLAAALASRRRGLVIPAVAALVLAAAVYRSLYPSVEYWDPKPIAVTPSPTGEIVIPKKGEVDLEDGNLHKYLLKRGATEVRFFVLLTPAGKITVDLDACAICKPDGYGQTEGTVICYYCKTLIPLDTVGKPGGCNPVPVDFSVKPDGVHLDAMTLVNAWNSTVQATTKIKEGGK